MPEYFRYHRPRLGVLLRGKLSTEFQHGAWFFEGGRSVTQKKISNIVSSDATIGKHVVGSSSMSNYDTASGNKVDTSSIAAKIHDIEHQILEGKLMLVGDDGIHVKPFIVDGQASAFPCLSNTFGTPNITTKVSTSDTSDTPLKNREDGLVYGYKSDETWFGLLNSMRHVSYANRLNGEPGKKVANFCTLIATASNGADVAISSESILEVKECFKNYVYGFFLGKKYCLQNNNRSE
ncbi:hypothetical protein Tco_0910673 [Tanacetum coccineum]|uniref:Uncharacterized protein n=1 Tax=Tanacetum coccineum TaxID=301880 RepID=A0ABQ5CU12_9ASTR